MVRERGLEDGAEAGEEEEERGKMGLCVRRDGAVAGGGVQEAGGGEGEEGGDEFCHGRPGGEVPVA